MRGIRTVFVALALLVAGPVASATAKQHVAVGRGGAVASDSTVATNAGLSVLKRGGSAADAAVAVASTLGVTDPFVAGIGGGGYFVYYDASTHRVYTIDGRAAGIYGRLSPRPLVDYSAVDVAVLMNDTKAHGRTAVGFDPGVP